jgi:Tol biopolymer transport system component
VKNGVLLLAISLFASPLVAQRRPVLPQIDLPHPYYYRELYLPQLTSGPSSVAWSPDCREVVFSMAGSLWRQKLDSRDATELTDGDGYDYQPDWSPDGKSIIYVSYQKDALELWLLDVASGKTTQLTSGGAVNVEPRWSPDGKRIVFVSTSFHKRFHIFRADIRDGKLENLVRLTGESKSGLPRYYYSQFDMEINPVWTRDGQEILFVSNKGHIHGTGGFWRMKAEPAATAREIHYEETSWKARPDFSPDGSRMAYSSYLGRQWHNLWVMPAGGGDAFPISYGDWDETNVRWSPDGQQLAFISNQQGSTQIEIQNATSARRQVLLIESRRYRKPHAVLTLFLGGDKNGCAIGRVFVTDSAGRSLVPANRWIFADDGFDRQERPMEARYFYAESGKAVLDVPVGAIAITVVRGFADRAETRSVNVSPRGATEHFEPRPLKSLDERGGKWASADLHVHRNYAGTYRNEGDTLECQAEGEHLDLVNNLVVNKEQRFPDVEHDRASSKGGSRESRIIDGQEFHTSYWGHRGILNLKDHLILPGYAGYPNTAAASLFPMNADVYDMAHEQDALVGAVHPFDEIPDPFRKPAKRITDELPVDVALGKLDYMEIVGFSDHQSTAAVWYKLLNLGYRIPAGAGTDATANYAAPIRGMVGFDRVYTWVPAWPLNLEMWTDGFKRGRTFATNGPLVNFTLNGEMVGSELKLEKTQDLRFTARLRSIVPVDHLEVVCNGKVLKDLQLEGARDSAEVDGTIPITQSGWCLLRTYTDKAVWPVLDNYAYATTSPVYVTVAGAKPRSREDAKYFAAWIARTMEVTNAYPDWNSPQEKELVMKRLRDAQAVYEEME